MTDLIPPKVDWACVKECRQKQDGPVVEYKLHSIQILEKNGAINPNDQAVQSLVIATLVENLCPVISDELKQVMLAWESSTPDQIIEAATKIQQNLPVSKKSQTASSLKALQINDFSHRKKITTWK